MMFAPRCQVAVVASARAASSLAASRLPKMVVASPSGLMTTKAGWVGIAKCSYRAPSLSASCGNVSWWRSTKPRNDVSSPAQATPYVATLPLQRWATSSTELASALQIVQVGAQNHNITARPASDAPSSWPPPRIVAVNDRGAGTSAVDAAAGTAGDALSEPPQAATPISATTAMTTRRAVADAGISSRIPARRGQRRRRRAAASGSRCLRDPTCRRCDHR
jgi:hypothetical protein